jgi:glucose-1-phosphate adenylyltransferase
VRIPEETTIGYDLEYDRRFHHVTDSGIVVVEGNRSPVEVGTLVV